MRFAIFLLPLSLAVTCWLSASADQTKQSSDSVEKRFAIIPGTKWCGSGNKARNYHDLGKFWRTDMCCRAHDHCPITIPRFGFKWGLFNPSPSTISHCECDDKFRACLKRVGNAPAKATGLAYFVGLGLNCFRFRSRRVCVQRYWFGLCKRYGHRRFAVARRNNWF